MQDVRYNQAVVTPIVGGPKRSNRQNQRLQCKLCRAPKACIGGQLRASEAPLTRHSELLAEVFHAITPRQVRSC